MLKRTDGDTEYTYTYDRAGRLTAVQSTTGGLTCTERELEYENTSNDGINRKLGRLVQAISNSHWEPDSPSANLPITETYEYAGLGGVAVRLSGSSAPKLSSRMTRSAS